MEAAAAKEKGTDITGEPLLEAGPQARPSWTSRPRRSPAAASPARNRSSRALGSRSVTRLSSYFLPTLREDPADAEALSHRLMVRAGLIRQLGAGLWTFLPAGYRVVKRVEQHHPRGDRRDRRPGDADARPPARGAVAPDGPLRDRRAVQAPGPQGRRAGAGDDPRGEPDLPRRPRGPLLSGAADDPVPRADQGARRAAAPRGRAAHARVHDEGLLQLRPRRRGARPQLRAAHPGLRSDLRSLRPALVPRRGRRRHDGRLGGSRVPGAVRGGGERGGGRARLRGERRGRLRGAAAGRAAPGAGRASRGADARPDDGRGGLQCARRAARGRAEGDSRGGRRTRLRADAGSRRPPPQRDQAAERPRLRLSPRPSPRRSSRSWGRPGSSGPWTPAFRCSRTRRSRVGGTSRGPTSRTPT